MIRKLSQSVRREFDTRMEERLSQFLTYKPASASAGRRLYRCIVASDLCLYILICMHDKRDAFTIETAWAEVEDWGPHSMVFGLEEEPDNGIFHFRLSELFEENHIDLWWEFARSRTSGAAAELLTFAPPQYDFILDETEEARTSYIESALSLVQPAVDDAIERICKYAIPYFGEIANARGYADEWEHAMRDQP